MENVVESVVARASAIVRSVVLVLLLAGCAGAAAAAEGNLHAETLSAPLGAAKAAKVDIDPGTGHLIVDRLMGDDQMLASGTLQYLEGQALPTQSVSTANGQAALTLRGGGVARKGFRLPWQACTGETEWQIHLNPAVSSDITAHTDGGNVRLNLAGLAVTRLSADSGGGNMEVVLPENAAGLNVAARTGGGNVTIEIGRGTTGNNTLDAGSGAGNVSVSIPGGMAARVHATSGMGKVTVDPGFVQLDDNTYQSPDYDRAADRVEITAKSGAGNVSITTK